MTTRSKPMNRLLSWVLCICMVLSLLPAMPLVKAQAIDTTTVNGQSYYQIGSAQDLMDFAAKVNGGETGISAILTADINMSGKTWTPMGTYDAPYSGNFDGDGHRIYNLSIIKCNTYVDGNSTFGHAGLFGNIKGAGVQNLTLEATMNTSIAGGILDAHRVGLLVGQMRDSIIYNCTTKGSVVFNATDTSGNISDDTTLHCVGGMLGLGQHSILINCGNEASVKTNGNIVYAAGGLVGYLNAGYTVPLCVLNSYNTGSLDVRAVDAAGLAGFIADDAVNNYSTGTVTNSHSSEYTGLLFGEITNSIMEVEGGDATTFTPLIKNNYYLSGGTAIGKLNPAGGTTMDSSGYATAFKSGALTGSLAGTLNGNLATVEKIIAGHLGYLTTSQWSGLIAKLNGEDVKAMGWHVVSGKPIPSECSFVGGVCACGALNIVASTTIKGTTTEHISLDAAIQAVANCTAEDRAVVTILKDIELGNSSQIITSGVFTIDLNGCEISSTMYAGSVLRISNAAVNVTIQDSGEGGCISGYDGVTVYDATLTITGGSFKGRSYSAVKSYRNTLTISGGSFDGWEKGLMTAASTVTISGGSFTGGYYGVHAQRCAVTITGGSFTGEHFGDIFNDNATAAITLALGKNGVGATFPGGIELEDTTLDAILGEGAAYWQGNTMIIPADDATTITGGDVVIKAACPHTADKSDYTDLKDGASHTFLCSGCNAAVAEGHTYTDGYCVCGAVDINAAVATTTVNGVTTYHLTLDTAIQAVANCTDADEAVVTILQNIALGDSYQEITSGVFTIDLNGFEISNTEFAYGALYIRGAATKVTVQGTGENSKITGDYAGIDLDNNAALTITGGKISGDFHGVSANGCSNVTVTNGTVSGDFHGVMVNNSTVKVVGGAISGTVAGVFASNNGTVIISGGSIYGDEYDIHNYDSTITLTVGEDGVGATFPGGIELEDTTLDAILGEGAAYWQGNTMIIPADDATTITGGDVTIKAVAQQVSPSINQKGRTLSYEDLIYVIDIFDLAGIEGIDLTKDAGLLIWSVEEFEALAEIAFDADHAKVGLKPYKTTGYYSGSSDGIFTRDLHKDAYYVGYVKLADGSYIYSEPKLYSPAIYAYNMLGKDTTSAETKELCVALLNYISAAQVYFHGTVEEDLVNYELTDEQKALNWENISFNLAPEILADKQVAMDKSVFQRTGKNLLFEEMISIVPIFVVNDDIVANAQETGTIFWTAEQFAALEGAPSIDNIGAGTKVEFSRYRGNVNQWCSYAPEVAAKDMADTQYFYLGYVIHADGSVSYSGVISYTVEQYISNKVNDPDTSDTMLAFAQWLYRYERAAENALK